MELEEGEPALDPAAAPLAAAKARCLSLRRRIERNLPPSKVPDACRRTLLRLLNAEIRHLSRLPPSELPSPLSLNVGYLESIVRVIEQPSVTGVSRICKAVAPLPSPSSSPQAEPKPAHVDVVCTLREKPVWILVSDRNPKFITWFGSRRSNGGLKAKVERIVSVARSVVSLKPDSIVLFFSKGISEEVSTNLMDEHGASELEEFHTFEEEEETDESEWINVVGTGSRAFEIKIACSTMNSEFCHLMTSLRGGSGEASKNRLINLDTTALIAFVSGISDRGGIERLLQRAEADLRRQFKGNYEFVMAQVASEREDPILPEFERFMAGNTGLVCETVLSEFKELVSMYGGANEKSRAEQLLKSIEAVADNPSARVSALPTTRKIALKNKIVFGTGDHFRAPTLTANEGFVRAVSQRGMSLATVKHRPRALIGD